MTEQVAEKPKERPKFLDDQGREWYPIVTTPVFMKACRELNVTVGSILRIALNVGDFIDFIWYTVENQAKERHMTHMDFLITLTLDKVPAAMNATMKAVAIAFPDSKEVMEKVGQTSGPFASGQLMTLWSSIFSQVSNQAQTSPPENSFSSPTEEDSKIGTTPG